MESLLLEIAVVIVILAGLGVLASRFLPRPSLDPTTWTTTEQQTMNTRADVDALLSRQPAEEVAHQLTQWADETRQRIARGDMMIGILSIAEVEKIPVAYRAAAERGDPKSWVKLAWWHAYPDFGQADLTLAEEALENAVAVNVDGVDLEVVKIRWFFKRDTATAQESEDAHQRLTRLVANDPQDATALYFLALLTTRGFGCPASPEAGVALLQRAADLGDANAMFELFIHYSQGLGVPADDTAAFKACQKAAETGHSRAMYNLGAFNAAGRGVPKNIPEAVKWYERAGDEGNPLAMAGLAKIYATGDGVEADLEYAEELLDRADYCGLDVDGLREELGLGKPDDE